MHIYKFYRKYLQWNRHYVKRFKKSCDDSKQNKHNPPPQKKNDWLAEGSKHDPTSACILLLSSYYSIWAFHKNNICPHISFLDSVFNDIFLPLIIWWNFYHECLTILSFILRLKIIHLQILFLCESFRKLLIFTVRP